MMPLCADAGAQVMRAAASCCGPSNYNNELPVALTSNPASLARYHSFSASAFTERPFILPGINLYAVAAGSPAGEGGLGIQFISLAAPAFRQSEAGLAYAKRLGDVDMGIRFNYHYIMAAGYGRAGTVLADLGSIWHLSNGLKAGVQLNGLAGGKLGLTGEKPGYSCKGGLTYDVSNELSLAAEICKEEDKPASLDVGFHYAPAERFFLRAGISTATAEPYICTGLQLRIFHLLMAVRYHPRLGLSPGLAISYAVIQKKKEQ